MIRIIGKILFVITILAGFSSAQQPPATTIPNLIRYGGILRTSNGAAIRSATVGVTFAIYKQPDGGAPIWLEMQNVVTDGAGQYGVLLGDTKATGLPEDLFSQQEPRWLGVQVEGQQEQPRIMLVSVPYAFKAGEADKLAGHTASEFVTNEALQNAVQQQLQQQVPTAPSPAATNATALSSPGLLSGLSWPIVTKGADYSILASDFSTPSTPGSFVVLVGSLAHTFILPAKAPANGACVAIGNFAASSPGSNVNTYLSVSTSGLNADGGTPGTFTFPRRHSYLICSDGTGYWRLGVQRPGVNQIGPQLYTVDTGTVNFLMTTFVGGVDNGVGKGTEIFLLPIHANTSTAPTLNVNGLGAMKITKFGTKALAPGDLTTTALAHLINDGVEWQLLNPQTIPTIISGTPAAGHATCWKTSGTIGYCSTAINASGSCTCN